jgi:CBS-domain-containing membrane protein
MTRREAHLDAMPVVTERGHVIGMVSEADMLRKQERPPPASVLAAVQPRLWCR